MPEHEEVLIDGDSTDEEEVCIITPDSRKRRRRSNIMTDQDDEEDEEEAEKEEEDQAMQEKTDTTVLSSTIQIQNLECTDVNDADAQHMTLCTPPPVRRSRRNLQQLSIPAAVARGDRGRCREHDNAKDTDNDDDDACIVQPSFDRLKKSSGRKRGRFMIQNNDEKHVYAENEQKKPHEHSAEGKGLKDEALSASRHSSRIEHKRQEKEMQHDIARKLAYPVLDNCLDKNIQSLGPHYQKDGNDSEEYQESELKEAVVSSFQKKRRWLAPREGERDECEQLYVDDGEDVDDFICADDEIEYMDENEEGAISVETPDDESENDPEELTAILAAGRSREIREWFRIYLEYLEECIIDPEYDNKMRRKRSKAKHQLYDQAVTRIERKLCSCRDAVRSGVAWPEKMVDALKCASLVRSSHVSAVKDCEACNRRQHVATYHVEFAGVACDATKLYGHNWMRHLKERIEEAASVQIAFDMGSVCHARTLAYWQLLHAKQFWCILVDAKIKQSADCTGRIAEQYRNEFFTKEFGRYKQLVGLLDTFAEDSKRLNGRMPNIWKRVTWRNMTSDFLPQPSRASSFTSAESRRGAFDAFVAETEEEGTEDEEAEMEMTEAKKQADASNDDNQSISAQEAMKEDVLPTTLHLDNKKEQHVRVTDTKGDGETGGCLVKDEKDIDDLMCLVCNASQRDAGVVHGLYLHVYCCYACAKRQHRMKSGCMVCNRPIDRVLRLLPLTLDARNAIRNQMWHN